MDRLREEGFTHALATTTPRVLPLYCRIDADVLAETRWGIEVRYLLVFDLARTRRHLRP